MESHHLSHAQAALLSRLAGSSGKKKGLRVRSASEQNVLSRNPAPSSKKTASSSSSTVLGAVLRPFSPPPEPSPISEFTWRVVQDDGPSALATPRASNDFQRALRPRLSLSLERGIEAKRTPLSQNSRSSESSGDISVEPMCNHAPTVLRVCEEGRSSSVHQSEKMKGEVHLLRGVPGYICCHVNEYVLFFNWKN